jgi:t-SNARE complex subunit (syntaxin)
MLYSLSIAHCNPLVKPDAMPEEVRAVVNDENGRQISSQAVSVQISSFEQILISELVDELQQIQ